MRGVGRTRPTGKVKERVTEERVNMKAKEEEEWEDKEQSRLELGDGWSSGEPQGRCEEFG